ncbi:LysR family transcriptional regulator [Alginatibacterium sediminis]|uniref:LysR family transcriptional regulator n=1 Tax=Alginatibacterium sediminis TaxID=2164068 RepID=A0A420E9J2_9ALTE|nr:LysR family transcriptional regulator [Alginatibacterium sediminis]RKF15772.1 LysR family transcriptional regulator [Alginatibacterium sediminis]
MLNLEQLNAFASAVEQGSFSAAARHLGKSQSSVSIAISNIELDLNVLLFNRDTKYPTLTEQGQRLYEQSKTLLRQADRIENYAKSVVDQVEDSIYIGMDTMVPLSIIETVLEKMAQQFPFTQVHLRKYSCDDLTQAIVDDQIQLAINLPMHAVPEHLDFFTFGDIEWAFTCSPDSVFADMDVVDTQTLISQRQIVCSSMMQNPTLKSIGKLSQELWYAFDLDDVIRLVEQGLGWAYVPKILLTEKQSLGSLIDFKPEFSQAKMTTVVDVSWLSNQPQGPAVKFILDSLKH